MEGPFISNPYDSSQPLSEMYNTKPDLVVLELSTPFIRTAVVAPACLPKTQINTGSSCFATGWGRQTAREEYVKPPPADNRSFHVFLFFVKPLYILS
jgi:hypothetical protein